MGVTFYTDYAKKFHFGLLADIAYMHFEKNLMRDAQATRNIY